MTTRTRASLLDELARTNEARARALSLLSLAEKVVEKAKSLLPLDDAWTDACSRDQDNLRPPKCLTALRNAIDAYDAGRARP